jgi:hypothetical protein
MPGLEQQAEQKGFYKIRSPYMDFGGIEWGDMSPGDRCIILWRRNANLRLCA